MAKKNPDGTKKYVHNDHLGSSSILTNQAGNLVESTTYDPWGKIKSGGTASKFLYTGQEHDNETGLDYYKSRYYGSDVRRFVQPDSIIANVYNPQQLNRYSYANNNPLKYIDPTGHINEILKYNQSLNQYYKKPNAVTYNNVLNTASSIQRQSGSTNSSILSTSGNSVNNSFSQKNESAKAAFSQPKNLTTQTPEAMVQSLQTFNENLKYSKANSAGPCLQGSSGAGAGGGGGASGSVCIVSTQQDGLVVTLNGGPKYYPAGGNADLGPAFMRSSAQSASELEGTDVSYGGVASYVVGASFDRSESTNDSRIWTNTYGLQFGYGIAGYAGPNYTWAFDMPGF